MSWSFDPQPSHRPLTDIQEILALADRLCKMGFTVTAATLRHLVEGRIDETESDT